MLSPCPHGPETIPATPALPGCGSPQFRLSLVLGGNESLLCAGRFQLACDGIGLAEDLLQLFGVAAVLDVLDVLCEVAHRLSPVAIIVCAFSSQSGCRQQGIALQVR